MLDWAVTETPCDRDHIPIIIKLMNARQQGTETARRNIKKAEWRKYTESKAWLHLERATENKSNEEILADLYARIGEAADEGMTKTKGGKFFQSPSGTTD